MQNEAIEQAWKNWHAYLENHDPQILSDLLAEEVVFHSPVVWTPQEGKSITHLYLSSAAKVLYQDFHYTRKVRQDPHWALEFQCQIGEVTIKGIDLIQVNAEGKIIDFEVMVRPLKAVQAIHQAMGQMLEKMKKKN